MAHQTFFIFLIGFTGGIAFRSFFDLGFSFVAFLMFIGVVLYAYSRSTFSSLNKNIFIVSLLIFSAGLGVLRYEVSDINREDPFINSTVNRTIYAEAIVVDEPDVRESNTRITVEFQNMRADDTTKDIYGKAIVTTKHYPEFKYGDRIFLSGKLLKPKNFFTGNSNIREFDYRAYLAKDGIYYQMLNPKIEFMESGQGNIIKEKLFAFKHAFLENLIKVMPEPHVSLLGGLIVGAKQSLGQRLLEDFRSTGIIHIVVLSGYNITIIAEAIMSSLSFLPRLAGIFVGASSIIMFALMVGAGATVVRASIMALLVLLARATRRKNKITFALFFAGFGMILWNPKILVFDPSFQLSFLATIGLVYLAPAIEDFFNFIPTKFKFREFATATISTQIFVLPLLLYQIGKISTVSLPVNILVLVFVPITMLFGFLAGMFGFVSIALSIPFAFISYWLLAYQLKIIELFASIPFASLGISFFPFWLMFLIYLIYIIILLKMKFKENINGE